MAHVDWEEIKGRRPRNSNRDAGYAAAEIAYELGEQVRNLRESRGWSQRDLSRRTGMTQPAIARFEAGGTTPTIPILQRLARAFDGSLNVEIVAKVVA